MTETQEEWIKKRAYALWEEEGRPGGRDHIHWEQAKRERTALEGSAASVDGKEVKNRVKRATSAPKSNTAAKVAAPKAETKRASVRKSA